MNGFDNLQLNVDEQDCSLKESECLPIDGKGVWDEPGAKSYFESMGARLEFEVVSYRPWAPKVYLLTRRMTFPFETLIELWDWWECRTQETMARDKCKDDLVSYFKKADSRERALMKAWAISPSNLAWKPENVGLLSEPPRFFTFELPGGWRDTMAEIVRNRDWDFFGSRSLEERFFEVEREELERRLPFASVQSPSVSRHL